MNILRKYIYQSVAHAAAAASAVAAAAAAAAPAIMGPPLTPNWRALIRIYIYLQNRTRFAVRSHIANTYCSMPLPGASVFAPAAAAANLISNPEECVRTELGVVIQLRLAIVFFFL